MVLHHARQVPADAMRPHVETGFTHQPGVHPVCWCPAAAVERTSWEVRTRGQLDLRSVLVGCEIVGLCVPMRIGTWQTGSSPVRTESKVRRDTSGVISDFANKGQALSFENRVTFQQNFSKSREVRQLLPNSGPTA